MFPLWAFMACYVVNLWTLPLPYSSAVLIPKPLYTGLWLAVLHQEATLQALAYCTKLVGEICQEITADIQTIEAVTLNGGGQCSNTWSLKLGSHADVLLWIISVQTKDIKVVLLLVLIISLICGTSEDARCPWVFDHCQVQHSAAKKFVLKTQDV